MIENFPKKSQLSLFLPQQNPVPSGESDQEESGNIFNFYCIYVYM